MRSIVSPQFRKMLDKLPEHVQDEARECFEKWKVNPGAVGWKKLAGMVGDVWSTQIGLRYRAIGVVSREKNAVVWSFVGSHEDYNNYINVRRKLNTDEWLSPVKDRIKALPSNVKSTRLNFEEFDKSNGKSNSYESDKSRSKQKALT